MEPNGAAIDKHFHHYVTRADLSRSGDGGQERGPDVDALFGPCYLSNVPIRKRYKLVQAIDYVYNKRLTVSSIEFHFSNSVHHITLLFEQGRRRQPSRKACGSCIRCAGTLKFFLDAQQCIVFGHTFAPSWSTCLDLANTEGNYKICNDSVLGFTAAVGDHDSPAIRLG